MHIQYLVYEMAFSAALKDPKIALDGYISGVHPDKWRVRSGSPKIKSRGVDTDFQLRILQYQTCTDFPPKLDK